MGLIYTLLVILNMGCIFRGYIYPRGPVEDLALIITKSLPPLYPAYTRNHTHHIFFAIKDALFHAVDVFEGLVSTRYLVLGGLWSYGTGHLFTIDYGDFKTHQLIVWIVISNLIHYVVSKNVWTLDWLIKFYYVNAAALAQSQHFSIIYITDLLTMVNLTHKDHPCMGLFHTIGSFIYWAGLYIT